MKNFAKKKKKKDNKEKKNKKIKVNDIEKKSLKR
jgi:hypothetical protein